jgi:hypothetical protein
MVSRENRQIVYSILAELSRGREITPRRPASSTDSPPPALQIVSDALANKLVEWQESKQGIYGGIYVSNANLPKGAGASDVQAVISSNGFQRAT